MKASLALSRYQWTELRTRWQAQPASPLARLVLTFALVTAAAVFLAGFAAAETARVRELQRLGFDTIVWRTPATSVLTENAALPADHWAVPLGRRGELTLLQQLPVTAVNPWGQPLPVLAAPFSTLAKLIPSGESGGIGAVWFTRSLPAGRRVQLKLEGTKLTAWTVEPRGRWQAMGLDEFLVVAPAMAAEASPAGRLDVVMFTPRDEAVAATVGREVQALFRAEGSDLVGTQDPLPLRQALAAFSRAQAQWLAVMMAALAGCVLLMYLAIGLLEERQTRFTQALLRSLGVPAGRLWLASWFENLLLANVALGLAMATAELLAARLLSFAGVNGAVGTGLPLNAVIALACAVNAGVLLGLFPLARALRRPVGVVLP